MTRALRQVNRWLTAVEELTLVQVDARERRWSWFQIAWAGLHVTAIVMHVISVLYHVRRTVTAEGDDALFVAGCPAPHARGPVALPELRPASSTSPLEPRILERLA